MSSMTDWDESDITRFPEDDDPETQAGEDDEPIDLADVNIDNGDWVVGLDA